MWLSTLRPHWAGPDKVTLASLDLTAVIGSRKGRSAGGGVVEGWSGVGWGLVLFSKISMPANSFAATNEEWVCEHYSGLPGD